MFFYIVTRIFDLCYISNNYRKKLKKGRIWFLWMDYLFLFQFFSSRKQYFFLKTALIIRIFNIPNKKLQINNLKPLQEIRIDFALFLIIPLTRVC